MMKTAKLGAIFLVSVMALAGIGAGYAMWFQDLTIDAEIHTGNFCVGIRDNGTGDPGPNFLMGGNLFPEQPPADGTADPWGGLEPWLQYEIIGDNSEGKNVASTISTDGEPKCMHEGVQFYHDIKEEVFNAYPWYCSWIYIEFANCGTVPAKIADGFWNITDDPDGIMNFLVVDEVWFFLDGEPVGPYHEEDLNGLQYQLDPCDTFGIKIFFHFCEEIDNPAGGDPLIMPQDAHATFQYLIKWAQWNEVPGAPTIP